jgi:hypothetical protein
LALATPAFNYGNMGIGVRVNVGDEEGKLGESSLRKMHFGIVRKKAVN